MVSETSQAETREERERLAFLPGSNVYRSLKKRLFPRITAEGTRDCRMAMLKGSGRLSGL